MTVIGLLRSKRARRLSLLLAIFVALVLLWRRGEVLFAPGWGSWGSVGSNDLLAHWSGARLLLGGGNPYDPAPLLAVQQAVGSPPATPMRFWNPPWILAVVIPLAVLPFGFAALTWLVLQLGLILGSGVLLWRYFAPGDRRYWIGLLLAAVFVPSLVTLHMGQMSGWSLVGVVGFLCAERRRRDLLAGAALALLMIKPHTTYLFWLTALWWAWQTRRWRLLLGWLAALTAASGLALVVAPDAFGHYLTVVTGPSVDYATPTLGTLLRIFAGSERFWLQFLPSVVGLLGLTVWLARRRGPWCWARLASPLLLVSSLTAAYGWDFDQLVLLPVVVDLVGRLRAASTARRAVVYCGLVATQVALLVQNRLAMGAVFYVWHPWALAGLCWWGVRQVPAAPEEMDHAGAR